MKRNPTNLFINDETFFFIYLVPKESFPHREGMALVRIFIYLTYNTFASLFIKNIFAVFFINDETKV